MWEIMGPTFFFQKWAAKKKRQYLTEAIDSFSSSFFVCGELEHKRMMNRYIICVTVAACQK